MSATFLPDYGLYNSEAKVVFIHLLQDVQS